MLVTKGGQLSKIDNRTLIDNLIVDQSFKTEKTNNILLIIKFVITFLPIVRNI